MPTLKAIETVYKGYRFRSRLEARWAVFFDALDVRWEYEKEGYDLGPAGWYLPDFWLPDLQCWYEVKGNRLEKQECVVAQALANASGMAVYVSIGQPTSANEVLSAEATYQHKPWQHRIFYFKPNETGPDGEPYDDACWWAQCMDCGHKGIGLWGVSDDHANDCTASFQQRHGHIQLEQAIVAARGARFEHGEQGFL